MEKNAERDLVELDGKPLLQTARASSDKHYQELGTSTVTGRTSTTEEWHGKFIAKKEHRNEPVNSVAQI